jgi:hypothetical protein
MKIMTSQNVTGMVISDILERDHLTRQVPLVEQELLTHLEHLSSFRFLVGLRYPIFILCVCFLDRCLSFCAFSFGHCAVYSSLNYGFWLPPFGIFDLFLNRNQTNLSFDNWRRYILLKDIMTNKSFFKTLLYFSKQIPTQKWKYQ